MKKFFLENFRCFKTKQEIPFRPLTLIYGANSSGKSSIIKSIMAFKQTFDFKANPNEILIGNGEFVDIGSFSDYLNDVNKDFCIEQEYPYKDSRRNLSVRNIFKPKELKIQNISVKYFYGLTNKKFLLKKIEIYASDKNKKTFF